MRMSTKKTVERSRRLRRQMSPAETRLWNVLRQEPGGHKFRRQHPLGELSLDFYCVAAALCVEVDGAAHDMGENPARDLRRDAWVAEQGITTIRFTARDVFDNLAGVVTAIQQECAARSPSTGYAGPPPPQRRGRISGSYP
jgi:very-short-patch-repair endonuclease